jgi:hypothetical protein
MARDLTLAQLPPARRDCAASPAHSACDNPSRVRISLSGEAEPAIGHDDAIGPPQFESERMAISGSRRPGNWAETAESISVGRFRPVAVSREIVAEFPRTDS